MTEERIRAAREAKRMGPAFLEFGFRPFFLGAGIQAVLAMAAWLTWIYLLGVDALPEFISITVPAHVWHAHEMTFGYGLAVVAGFLLTAVPSWTGRQPVHGSLLGILFALWVAARLTNWFSVFLPTGLVALPELAFIGMLSILVGHALLSGWSKRNFLFLPVLAAMFGGSLLYYFGHQYRANILGLDILLLLITVIGGRIVPAFTTNVLRRVGAQSLPRAAHWRDKATILAVVGLTIFDFVMPGSVMTGYISLGAGILVAARMIGWQTSQVAGSPILWILHIGYGWLAIGFVVKGGALAFGLTSEITAIHALTVGAIGSMTLGVMTRAALGHTGRELRVSVPVVISYVLVSVAALMRIAVPIVPPVFYDSAILMSGAAWIAAYTIFTAVYWPILTRPRISLDSGA